MYKRAEVKFWQILYVYTNKSMILDAFRSVYCSLAAKLYHIFQQPVSWYLEMKNKNKNIYKVVTFKAVHNHVTLLILFCKISVYVIWTVAAKGRNIYFQYNKHNLEEKKIRTLSASCSSPVSWCSISSSLNSFKIYKNKHCDHSLSNK